VYNVGLQASWEIDFWGRIRSLKDQALAQYLSTAYARKAAEISLVSQVADQYLTLLSDDDLLKVTQDTLKTAQDSYNLTKMQFDTGTGTELDLRQAQSVVEQTQANLQAQLRARAQAVNALVLLIGEPLPEDLPQGLPLDGQALLADIPAGFRRTCLPGARTSCRPRSLLAANANIGAARAAFSRRSRSLRHSVPRAFRLAGCSRRARRHGASSPRSRCRSSRAARTSRTCNWRT
jgi:multidrug efflux system outer membrane protein